MREVTPSPQGPPDWAAQAGPRLDHYLLGPELGRGGMGRVVEAWDTVLQRRVAIKLLHTIDPVQYLRFFREAQAQARLEHPNICRILEMGVALDRPYLVMPLIKGQDLGELRPSLATSAIARLLAEVAEAIHAAHNAGLVHRDLKPQNILVEALPDGAWHPIVVDFGLARDLGRADQTLTWAMVGTPAFMSPEQARGAVPTPAADIYSLGATLYAMLSGAPPFEAATLAGLLAQQERQQAPALSRLAPGLPRDLVTVTLKCLEADPGQRYPSAFELASDLRRFLAGEPIRARPITRAERAWRKVKRNRPLALTVAASLLLVGAMGGWTLRTMLVARRQVVVAQRFGMEVRGMEDLLRVERMLPPHDMRPVERQVREQLAAIEITMGRLGAFAQGPGHYALGRGLLALRDLDKAQTHLEAAWKGGYQGADMATSLATLHSERYHKILMSLFGRSREERRQLLDKARKDHLEPAVQLLGQTDGSGLESRAVAQARIALMEGRYEDCSALSLQALNDQPWRYEALLLAASARLEFALDLYDASAPDDRIQAIFQEQVLPLLDRAQDLARSDVAVHSARLQVLWILGMIAGEQGRPTLDGYQRADVIFREALRIQPMDEDLWIRRNVNAVQEVLLRLSHGEDARALCRELLKGQEAFHAEFPSLIEFKGTWAKELWIQGEALFRRGEDPRPSISAALAAPPSPGIDEPEARKILALYLAQHGQDPTAQVQRVEECLAAEERDHPGNYFYGVLSGEIQLILANWQWSSGRDPAPAIERGLDRLRHSSQAKPDSVYPFFYLPPFYALEARVRRARGQDPGAAVAEALRCGRRAVAIRPDHFLSQLALAEALRTQAWDQIRRQGDPGPSFRSARQALAASHRLNPTDWRVALGEARLALEEAEAAGKGPAALPLLDQADQAVARGLAVKGDCPELLWARGEAARRRWVLTAETAARVRARAMARKALDLWPDLAPARELLGATLQGPARAEVRPTEMANGIDR